MNIFFTSDQHFSHANIIKYCNRPFQSVEEMNEELIRRHNAIVKPGDLVYHLGDFSLWKHGPTHFLPRLNGKHHLIAGNHDWVHPVCYKKEHIGEKMRKLYHEAGFETIKLHDVFHLWNNQYALGHHMPYLNHNPLKAEDPCPHDIRYAELRPADNGNWLLHGHVHERWKVRGRMINVGVDVWAFAPVSLEEIAEIITNGVQG